MEVSDNVDNRCGIVAVVGRTNSGKSTMVNKLVGEKVSIVTPVVQTTRNNIRAILTEPRGQLVFIDTPGIHKSKHELGKMMNKMARSSAEGSDLILFIMDSSEKPHLEDDGCMRRYLFSAQPCIFVLNKCDEAKDYSDKYRKLWDDIQNEKEHQKEVVWLSTSATEGDGIDELMEILFNHVPLGPMLFPEDLLTDFPRKLAIADVVREKLFHYLHDELPHSVAVWVDKITESGDNWEVDAVIYVDRNSQKGIVLGKKGRSLKNANSQVVKELEEMFECKVKLNLWVKVEKNWRKNYFFMKKLGYIE